MPLTVDLLNIGFIFVNVFATSCFISISVNKPLFYPSSLTSLLPVTVRHLNEFVKRVSE